MPPSANLGFAEAASPSCTHRQDVRRSQPSGVSGPEASHSPGRVTMGQDEKGAAFETSATKCWAGGKSLRVCSGRGRGDS